MIMNLKTLARIHSLSGELAEVIILEKCGDNDYIVEFNGVKCHAILNGFTNCYYADDVFRRISSDDPCDEGGA